MADETAKPKEPQAEKKASQPGVMVLAGIMLAGSFLSSFLTAKFMAPQGAAEKGAAAEGQKDGGDKNSVKDKTIFFKLGEFVVNLANKESTRYLKTDITMEVKEGKETDKVLKEKESKYRDAILEKLTSYTTQQLSTAEGKKMMKQDIMSSITDLDSEIKVENIYFNTLMMQ